MIFDYVIYHRNCLDGFASFFLLHHKNLIDENAIIYPDQPSSKMVPPNITDKKVIIIDVAYGIDVLKEISEKASYLFFIDHHITTFNNIQDVKLKNTTIIYDKTKSGVSLTWTTFYESKKMPAFIRYIEDHDTGTYKYNYTKQFILSLEVNYSLEPTLTCLMKWDKLFDKQEISHLIKLGKFYLQYDNTLVNMNKNRYSLMTFPSSKIYNNHKDIFNKAGQYTVAVYCGAGCPSVNSVSNVSLDELKCDFVLMWVYLVDKKEYRIMMRSNDVNVNEIAKIFGGGGHEKASAFSFSASKYVIDDLFNEMLLREG